MCDICTEVIEFLEKYENEIQKSQLQPLSKPEISILCSYVQAWTQRQCTCCYKDPKNFDRFNSVIQGLILSVLEVLQKLLDELKSENEKEKCDDESKQNYQTIENSHKDCVCDDDSTNIDRKNSQNNDGHATDMPKSSNDKKNEDIIKKDEMNSVEFWSLEDREKLLHFSAKVFLLNFPLYVAFKHSVHSKLEEVSQEEVSALNNYCDVNDMDIPVYLLRNVCFFCERGGLKLFTTCFQDASPILLPMTVAHAMIAVISNLKLWMNIGSIMQHLVPLRSCVIRYLCKVSDADLRITGSRNMFEFMWTAVKDPLDAHATFDREGLDLAFKYFSSTTLTMRLAGIAQINSHINMYNELCHNESLVEVEGVGNALANWLTENKITEHIFGPNLHVEIIKQSHILLNFLAMEGRITNEHIDAIWCAAQLKHCSRQVLDLLPPLIKNLEVGPVLHLYKLLCNMEPKEHTEQTLLLASALTKFIWTNGGSTTSIPGTGTDIDHSATNSPFSVLMKGALHMGEFAKGLRRKHELSSSERSVSVEASNSEDEPNDVRHAQTASEVDSSQVSDRPRSSGEGSEHTADSQPSSPCEDSKQHLPLNEKKLSNQRSANRKWRRKRSERRSNQQSETEKEDGASSADATELSSVSDDSLQSDTDPAEGTDSKSDYHKTKCSPVGSDESGREGEKPSHIWRRKILRKKRARLISSEKGKADKKPVMQVNFSEDSMEKTSPLPHAVIQDVTGRGSRDDDDDDDDDPGGTSRDGEIDADKKNCISEVTEDQATNRICGPMTRPQLLPQLVKAVLEREGGLPQFTEGVDSDIYECRQYLASLHPQRHLPGTGDLVEDILSPDDGSCNSSRVSNKSEKNMADFEGEESGCEDELAQLAAHAQAQLGSHPMTQRLANMACMYTHQLHGVKPYPHHRGSSRDGVQGHFDLESVCNPGQTLLWDLLQDDKIVQLGEGLALEAEKVLCNLVCWSTDKMIRMKFIEGCLNNLANNRSVVVSLRLLPKLLGSFQQFRGGSDTHSITMWAEREHKMMNHFFNNLVTYTSSLKTSCSSSNLLYCHKEEIQVRLHFLTCVFSAAGSPDNFGLSKEQVDMLWSCLATDNECADELFSWFLNQAMSKDQHALNLGLFKHVLLEKMPQLPAQNTSMTALSLLQQLSSLAHLATASYDTPTSEADVSGMQQLWAIALRALNTDVSMAAIQYLNNYYINVHHGTLEKEEEFIERCMGSLISASQDIKESEENNLMVIQRALLLLKTHIEAFRRRYAYHLRRWQLADQSVSSHRSCVGERQSPLLRIVCQPAGLSEKTTVEMQSTDYVADLRAEVSQWWEQLQKKSRREQQDVEGSCGSSSSGSNSALSPILGTMLSEGPIRMISQGQELTCDLDEKTLSEMGFKDLQLVFVSVGAARPVRRREGLEPASTLPPPPQERLPITLLLQSPYFEQLFSLMQQLGYYKTVNRAGESVAHTRAQVLSRRVWEILTMLPTSPVVLEGFKDIAQDQEPGKNTALLQKLLNPEGPPKLMYSLQIVESLRRQGSKINKPITYKSSNSDQQQSSSIQEMCWSQKFVEHGGLRHLFDIFVSGVLQARDGEEWNEWNQDCVACLLRLIYQFGIGTTDNEIALDNGHDNGEMPRKKTKRSRKGSTDKLLIPKLNKVMLQMMGEVETVLKVLLNILYEAALPCDPNQYKTGFWGRAQVVYCAMTLLVSWAVSDPLVKTYLFQHPNLESWLKRLVLDDPEPAVRRETCTGLYRLCLGSTVDGKTGLGFIAPLLNSLLSFLSVAQNMRPPRPDEEEKEPYGPGCKDYFWLICRLVDSLDDEILQENAQDQKSLLDLESLARYLAEAIISRDFRETRHNTIEDDGLRGLLTLATVVIKHNPPFKFSKEGQEFLLQVFDCLFALPSPGHRYLPKCKSQPVRSAAFDLLVELVKGCEENYKLLHTKLLNQHSPESHAPYPWDYWPHEDGRSECGYVGLTNLGATCYLASCMQHLYMMPQARASILAAKISTESKHENTLRELQRMFAYLLESERKAYNPRSFCKVYTMDHQPLNTGEQKDMAEFFTDLISKLEEMTQQLKELVKKLFCGVLSNNVVSLDCPHISCTLEEFYTLRCQVADMRNLYESLDELTVKDTLEGDNMYTCSQCGKKVRAEKRACIKKLPRILCFNTMRYTFNMVTMTKEKVNTHFSFPLRLDMSNYMERNLMPNQHADVFNDDKKDEEGDCYEYDLIGVTVHTGTADGGHYYSFIRERQNPGKDKWFLFNDAEVKPFDPAHIAAECFGGEMTSKTYDSVTDKFMDFSFEKTNSAYMLFYERVNPKDINSIPSHAAILQTNTESQVESVTFELSHELAEWIWQDNMHFLQDKSVFEHTYFNFMWQICGYIPQTLSGYQEVTLLSAKLGTSFVLETLIHAKEKPTIAQWIELLTKQFNASQQACEWFLDHMAENNWWPVQILIKCPNQVVRQLFQRLCIHVINQLKPVHSSMYLQPYSDSDDSSDVDISQVGQYSCVTRFIKKLLTLIEHGAKQHLKHLTEYFAFLLEFAKMGEEECQFLLSIETISTIVNFYLGQKSSDYVEVVSDEDDDDEDEVVSSVDDKYKPASLEKMITLIALLVEKSRGDDQRLHLSHNDFNTIAGGKGFPFLYQQIRDSIHLRQTCNLIFSLCRWNEHLAHHIVNMVFSAIAKQHEGSGPFFKLLSMLVEFVGGPPGMPPFTNLVLQRIWEAAEYCPQQCLEWLTVQVPRNKMAHTWVLQSMDSWVERFLIAHNMQRVRNVAALLLVSLVPSNHFRQTYRSARSMLTPQKEIPSILMFCLRSTVCFQMSGEALIVMHQIYDLLLRLLKRAKLYVDPTGHGTTKLTSYFAVMTYSLISRSEKLMFSPYFLDLWNLFQPKLSEPAIPVHHNKQALLIFWYQVCIDCPENVKLIVQNSHVTKNIAFNYILADHDDQEVVVFNRCMLPAYYGLLRLCCQQSRTFTRQLANHQNIQWAFKNITPYTTQYTAAINELFKLMRLFVAKYTDSTEQELREIHHFKRTTLRLYLTVLDARACWATLINALRILVETTDDRLFVICSNGLALLFQAFHTLHMMYHEATACHVTGDMVELLAIALDLLKCARACQETTEIRQWLIGWKEHGEASRKLLTLMNSFTPPEVRHICTEVLQELVLLYPSESLSLLVPLLASCHASFQENNSPVTPGPFFPRRGQKILPTKSNMRPQRPMLQMFLHPSQLETAKGIDDEYDSALLEFFLPYHQFIDMLCRVAVSQDNITSDLVNLSAMVAIEGVPLHLPMFPKLWLDILHSDRIGREFLPVLCNSSYFIDYLEAVLLDERACLNHPIVYQLFSILLPQVANQVINDQMMSLVTSLMTSLVRMLEETDLTKQAWKLNGDLRALTLVFSVEKPTEVPSDFSNVMNSLIEHCKEIAQAESREGNVESEGEREMESETHSEEMPSKRRRLSTGSESTSCSTSEGDGPGAGASPGRRCSDGTASGQPRSSSPPAQNSHWADILAKSAGALLSVLETAR